jgi:beta-glucanase (GH16 family)
MTAETIAALPDSSLTFHDDFTTLDRTRWTAQVTAKSRFTTGGGVCSYVDDPSVISVEGGCLELSARRQADGKWLAGELMTLGSFQQTYGRFEVRAKLPQYAGPGLQETFWLWPVTQKYGVWPLSGEVDFAEFYSQHQGLVIPYLHYAYRSWSVQRQQNVPTTWTARIDPTVFNTFGVDWRPGILTLYVNGVVILTDRYEPCNVTAPAPFDQPMFLALTQGIGVGTNAPTSSTPPVVSTVVDYVKVWK